MRPALAITFGLAALTLASSAHAQFPHNIPNLCASVPDKTVVAAGTTQTLTGNHSCIEVRGAAVVTGTLRATTLLCYRGGSIEFAEGSETIWRDGSIDLDRDPEQWGHGLVAFDCRVRAKGQAKTPAVRLAEEAAGGATALTLERPAEGWSAGDRVALPDTRHLRTNQIGANYVPQWEERTIAAISGRTVTLSAPLTFGHRGARNADGVVEFLPHVMNLTRSITIRSENPQGTRGHMAFIGRADVDLRGVELRDMGRTTSDPLHCTLRNGSLQNDAFCDPGSGGIQRIGKNQIGRYPVHFHHLDGPAGLPADVPQFTFAGNAVTGSRKWPIAIHNSHYGLVKDNVVWGFEGAGVMTEDGSETGNVIERNFVFKGERSQGSRAGGGREGVAFYFRGPNNFIRGNVAGNVMPHPNAADSAYGFKYFFANGDQGPPLGPIRIPQAKGDSGRRQVGGHTLPIAEFSDNECYGAMESCLTYWWIGTFGNGPTIATATSTFKNLRVWHVHNKAIFHYEAAKIVHDGLTVRGANPGPTAACCGVGFDGADYKSDDVTIRNADIQGINTAIAPSSNGSIAIEKSRFRTLTDIYLQTLWTSAAWANTITRPRLVTLRDVSLEGATKVRLDFSTNPVRHLLLPDEIRIEGASGTKRVYYAQQAPGFVVPPSQRRGDGSVVVIGAPEVGLTNEQAWRRSKIAIAGAVASCSTTQPAFVNALVCDAPTPPARSPPDRR